MVISNIATCVFSLASFARAAAWTRSPAGYLNEVWLRALRRERGCGQTEVSLRCWLSSTLRQTDVQNSLFITRRRTADGGRRRLSVE